MKFLSLLSGILAALALFGMVAILLAEIVVRPFGLIIHSAADIATLLMVAVAWFGVVHTFAEGKHIRVEILTRHFPDGLRQAVAFLSLVLATLLLVWLAWTSGKLTYTAWRFNDMTDTVVRIHLWIPMSVVPVGLSLFALATAHDAVMLALGRDRQKPMSDEEEALALARGKETGA